MSVQRIELDTGLRVVSEPMPGSLTASFGVWIGVGARDESPELAGASHFLEHLLFKGTRSRTSREISEAIEGVGGDLNAFTTKEATVFYVQVPAAHAELALDIVLDVTTDATLAGDDVEAERHVILEEIGLRDDTPDDLVHDLLLEAVFGAHPLGRDVLGTRETIGAMGTGDVAGFFHEHYGTASAVVAAAGAIDPARVATQAAARLTAVGRRPPRTAPEVGGPGSVRAHRRRIEQVHLCMGVPAPSAVDDRRFALTVLTQVLGGGTASRLFEEVRERRSLAYSVYSYLSSWSDAGLLAVYLGCAPRRADEAARVVLDEIRRLADGGVTQHELDLAIGYVEGSAALGLETSASRMSRLGQTELIHGRVPPIEEYLARYRAVTVDDVASVCAEVLGGGWSVAAVGPVTDAQVAGWVA